jgi:hypothetical protein
VNELFAGRAGATLLDGGYYRDNWQNGNASMEHRWHRHHRMHRG